MNKKNKILIIIIMIIAIIAIASSLYYFTYIADHTYEDERISITVPAATEFNIKAESFSNDFNMITYNDTSDKNIVIKLVMVPKMSFFGMDVKDLAVNSQEQSILNDSYGSVKVTENYTIYKNEKTGRYNALIKSSEFNGYVLIGCNGDLKDIENLAKSFKFKSFTTDGLTVTKVNNTLNGTNNTSNQVSTHSSNSKNNNDSEKPQSEWGKEDYLAHGYGSDVSDDYTGGYGSDGGSEYGPNEEPY